MAKQETCMVQEMKQRELAALQRKLVELQSESSGQSVERKNIQRQLQDFKLGKE